MLIHAVRVATASERAEAARILAKPRPNGQTDPLYCKTAADVQFLRELIDRTGAVQYALTFARSRADRARRSFDAVARHWRPSVHRDFLIDLVDFVVKRDW
jgi:geranylgeranyl diphosphate synthase type II